MCQIVEFLKYYVIFIYFQAAVSALLAVSVLYNEKNQNKYYGIFQKFDTYQIASLKTCQRHKGLNKNYYIKEQKKSWEPVRICLLNIYSQYNQFQPTLGWICFAF